MSQHDYNLANATGAAFRADLNAALDAIVTLNTGATAPSVTFANMLWYDTTAGSLKKRNNANTSWADLISGSGTIGGSTGATDNRLLRSDGTGGATLQNSPVTVDDSGNMSGVGTIGSGAVTSTGTVAGTGLLATSTDAGATVGPTLDLYRDSASPAAADVIGAIDFNGRDSAANKQLYASIRGYVSDPTSASEDAGLILQAALAGAITNYLYVGVTANQVELLLGQLAFPATANPSSGANVFDDYEEGTWTVAFSATGCTFNYNGAVRSASYTKAGAFCNVHFTCILATSGNTLAANNLALTGFPFAVRSGVTELSTHTIWHNTTATYLAVAIYASSTLSTWTFVGRTVAATSMYVNLTADQALHATLGTLHEGVFTYPT